MAIRIEIRKEFNGEVVALLECDDRIPSEEIIPWTETFRSISDHLISGPTAPRGVMGCDCPAGMDYHALNCPIFPGEKR